MSDSLADLQRMGAMFELTRKRVAKCLGLNDCSSWIVIEGSQEMESTPGLIPTQGSAIPKSMVRNAVEEDVVLLPAVLHASHRQGGSHDA